MQCNPRRTLDNAIEFICVMSGNGPGLQFKYEHVHILLVALECCQKIPRNWTWESKFSSNFIYLHDGKLGTRYVLQSIDLAGVRILST